MKPYRMILNLLFLTIFCGTLRAEEPAASVTEAVDVKVCQQDEAFSVYLRNLADKYFSRQDYEGFYQHLGQLLQEASCAAVGEVYYYRAICRYEEIAYWKKTKNWEGVYDKSAGYKKEIAQDLKQAQSLVKDDDLLSLEIAYVNWQNVREEEPELAQTFFKDMFEKVKNLKNTTQVLEKIKQMGDACALLEDKNIARRFYDAYLEKLEGASLSPEELKAAAEKFLAESNLYPAKAIFDAYLNKVAGDDIFAAKQRIAIANKFAYQDDGEGLDPVYAEIQYKRASDLTGITAFDADAQFRRAFNQERMKEYQAAFDEYKILVLNFSDKIIEEKIYFRMGVLAAYGLKNKELASVYFYKVTQAPALEEMVLSGFYQLGLLKQWEAYSEKVQAGKDLKEQKARELYGKIIELAGEAGAGGEESELVRMTRERLLEIGDKKEMKYGLKLFLEGVFSAPQEPLALTVDLTVVPPKTAAAKPVHFLITTSNPQTGCMTPVYSYEWSGETGATVNVPNAPELHTDYLTPSIKVAHVAVVGSKGLEGVSFDMTEIR